MNRIDKALPTGLLLLCPLPAMAADGVTDGASTAWILTSTALVLMMTLPGLALFYGGLVRAKNVLSILMQCFAIACLASILWVVAGYGLSFGDGGTANPLIGAGKWFLSGITAASLAGGIPESVYLMFQMTFAIITPALVIGGFAERIRFVSVLGFALLWSLLVYFPVCHWVWGGGWLAERNVMDFAGGIVVHTTAGVAALVAALVLGRRRGFPATAMPPHNLTATVTGAGLLWVGWFGFNGGSALSADGSAGMAILATHIAASAGAFTWMTIEWLRFGKPSVLGTVTGLIAGLGTITPAAGHVGPAGALAIGVLAGLVCFSATQYLKRVLKIDDSLDVFPVHGVGGIVGSILTAIFASPVLGGAGYAQGMDLAGQLQIQVIALVATIIWCALATFLILRLLDATFGLRVSPDEETEGLDVVEHEERGYIF
ncbi:MAG: ammonium transporter [Gammaproteobacteria bacterium]|nr:MAG: ammonium transporter [Gammaproteobacteria bacterium]